MIAVLCIVNAIAYRIQADRPERRNLRLFAVELNNMHPTLLEVILDTHEV